MQDILKPPAYCPDAIATDVGWINPKNGELLITVRNLRQKISEADKIKEFKREGDMSPTVRALDALTEIGSKNPREDDRSQTQRVLDQLTDTLTAVVEEKSTTQKVLDELVDRTVESVTMQKDGNDLTLEIKETANIEEEFKKPRKAGRPKKVKE